MQTSEYLDIFDVTEGMRLVVHNQTTMPVPETQGINIPTGFDTRIVIKRVGIDNFLFHKEIVFYLFGQTYSFKIEKYHHFIIKKVNLR